jgi:RNase adaptor protein for sRNA GlmZ degradation
VPLGPLAAERLVEADRQGIKYQLVHVGTDDGVDQGSFRRAHHRVEVGALPPLAQKLKSRARMLVRVLAFGYKHGLPPEADWVIDARFLKNPYWVEELRQLDGRDSRVQDYVLRQSAAADLMERLAGLFAAILPDYRAQGRTEVTIAFGCTGGRHRSVALAAELAGRLERSVDADVEAGFREL